MASRREVEAQEPSPEGSPVLIVTGASRGIGASTAILAARRGFAVCVNYLREREKAADVVRAIQQENGRAVAVQADISSEPDVVRLFETVDRELGHLSALVNNAATIERQARLDTMDAARLSRTFATNDVELSCVAAKPCDERRRAMAVREERSSTSPRVQRGQDRPASTSTMPLARALLIR